jgi:hypothetical protein
MGHNNGQRIGRVVALAAAAAAVLGAAAACTGSSGTGTTTGSGGTSSASASPSPNSVSASASANAQVGAPTSTQAGAPSNSSTAPTPGSGSGSSGNPQAGSGGTSSCTGSQIKVSVGRQGAATGHHGLPVVFTNTSSQTCTLQGYPGAAIMNGSTTVLNATRTLNGFIGDERQLSSAPLVTLAPGGSASAMLEWVVDNGEPCGASGTGTLEVTPPNTTVTTGLLALTAGPSGICADFEIHPAVSGTL